MRWLAGKSNELIDWSPYSMGPVLDTVEELFQRVERDGRVLLDPQLRVFKDVEATQPAFRDYLKHMYEEETIVSPDGQKEHLVYQKALKELLDPEDESNKRSLEKTVEYLQVQCRAGLIKLHDQRTVLPQYLTSQDGAKCWAKMAQAHSDTKGTEATNDKFSESVFCVFDRMLKIFHGISREAASGLAQAIRAKSFWQGDVVLRRKSQEPPAPGIGYFFKLPLPEQESLVEYVRVQNRPMHKIDAEHNAEVAAYVKAKVRTNSEEQLKALVTEWAYGMSFFDRWQERGVRTVGAMTAALNKIDAENQEARPSKRTQLKLDWLREQIEMRTRGLRWVDFATKWSSTLDDDAGSVADLEGALKEIIDEERERRAAGELPEAAPAPLMKMKTYKELGTPTAQAEALAEMREVLTEDELGREKVERERERLEAVGEIDAVGDAQPEQAPEFDTLVGWQLELRWRYYVTDNSCKSGRRSEYIWCTGEVVEVANGRTTKKTAGDGIDSRTVKETKGGVLPWNAVRVRWPEDKSRNEPETFVWTLLYPADFNKERHLSWRYDHSSLVRLRKERLVAAPSQVT